MGRTVPPVEPHGSPNSDVSMHAPSPKTVVNDLGKQQKNVPGYLLAGVLLHVVTAVELILFLAITGIDHHPVRDPAIVLLGVAILFTQLDARSRFQEYKRLRDQLIRYGPDRRIFFSIAGSRCQRDAGLAAARQLGHETACRRIFLTMGYRWYHLLPDFVLYHPGYLLSSAFLRRTFFLPAYTSRFPPTVGMGMTQSKNRLRLVFIAAALLISESALAYEEVEDLVDILATDDAFIAVVDGRRKFLENRRSGETIAWQGAKGEVGAFLTNDRILGISLRSGQWNTRFLKINEKKVAPQMLLAKHLVVMFSDERILGFGTHTGGFFQERLPLGEPVIASAAEGRVAAVISADRAFGLSTFRRGAAEIRFQIREQFKSVRTTYNKISLRTSLRLITFTAEDAVWRDIDLD